MTPKTIRTTALALAACLGSPMVAQDLGHKAAPQDHPIYLVGGTVHTVSGDVIEQGAIGFDNGVITFVGSADAMSSQTLGEGTEIIDTTGKHVFPGMIATSTQLGLTEFSAVGQSNDHNERGQFSPEVFAASAVNPDSTLIPVTRSNGILTFGSVPTRGRIPGRLSVMRADGWTNNDMAIDAHAGLMVSWPRVSTGYSAFGKDGENKGQEQVQELTDYFDAAEAYLDAKAADPTHPSDIGFDAMAPMLAGDKPVFISANDYDQIVSAVTWSVDRGLNPVIFGARDALLASEILRAHDVPVVLNGTYGFPKRSDSAHDERHTLPQRLTDAGVRFAMNSSDENGHTRNLPYDAARAIAYGMDPGDALAAVTLWPAQVLGVADRLGSLETGKLATLIVTDGHCLDITSNVELGFIDGRQIDLGNKQTRLRDKYRAKYKQLGLIED